MWGDFHGGDFHGGGRFCGGGEIFVGGFPLALALEVITYGFYINCRANKIALHRFTKTGNNFCAIYFNTS